MLYSVAKSIMWALYVLWSLSSLNLVSLVPLGDVHSCFKTEDFTGQLRCVLAAVGPGVWVSFDTFTVGVGAVVFPTQGGTVKLMHLTHHDELELLHCKGQKLLSCGASFGCIV